VIGIKEPDFVPLGGLMLDRLVPDDNFYRHLNAVLDLGIARDLVREKYAPTGRPSIFT
jgi:hypothetical protein